MFSLFLIILLVVLGLAVLLWIGTSVVQGIIYTEPVGELYWRAPAVAGALGFFLLLWCILAYNNPDTFDTLFSFTTGKPVSFTQFWSRDQLPGGKLGREVHYVRRPDGSFRNPANGQQWVRAQAGNFVGEILIDVEGTKTAFRPTLNSRGNPIKNSEGDVVYHEVGGDRVLTESDLLRGELQVSHTGLFWLNFFFNLIFLAIWFVGLWLLLQFQLGHALGFALLLWVIASVPGSLVSGLLGRAGELGREPTPPTARRTPISPRPGLARSFPPIGSSHQEGRPHIIS